MPYITATIELGFGGDVYADDIEVRCGFTFGGDAEDIRDAGPIEVRCFRRTDGKVKEVWNAIAQETHLYAVASRAINGAPFEAFQDAFDEQDAGDCAAFNANRYAYA